MIQSAARRTVFVFLGLLAAVDTVDAGAQAPEPWTIPSNEQITQLLAGRMKHNGVGVVVGIIEPSGQRIVTYGKSGAKDGRPLDGDTVFQIGSVTKSFTGLLLADMVVRGEVKLDDPAAKYLPQGVSMPTTGAPNARPITLHHLATHMSGLPSLPNNFDPHGEPNPLEAYTADNLYRFLSTYKLPREPGDKGEYSNLGVALLGRLLGRRAGVEYEALLKQRVLDPLGMKSTSITLTPDQTARLAPGHSPYLQPEYVWEMRAMPASGSLRSTANDMLRFLAVYLGYADTPLKAAIDFQLQPRIPPNATREQVPGFNLRTVGEERFYEKDGGKSGYRAQVIIRPSKRTGIVVLENARTDDRPLDMAFHILAGRPLKPAPAAPAPRKIVPVDQKVLASYAGRYEKGPGNVLVIVPKGDRLLVAENGDEGAFFYPTSARDFYLSWGNDEMSFEVDDAGRVQSVRYYPDGREAGNVQTARPVAK